jgi:Flp pilus assembly protein TadD
MSDPAALSPAGEVNQLHSEAKRLIRQRNFGAAQQACLRLLQIERKHADAHFLLGIISAEIGQFVNAVEFMRKAISLAGGQPDYYAHLGRCLAMLKREGEATEAVEKALASGKPGPLTLDTIGVVYSRLGLHEKAAGMFGRAAEKSPTNPAFQFNLGSSLKFLGRFEEAEEAYEKAIDWSPRFYKAHSALSNLRKQTPGHNHIKRLESLLTNIDDDVDGGLHLRHALAKEYEDIGQTETAFEHLQRGNQQKRVTLDYSIDDDRERFHTLERLFDSKRLSAPVEGLLTSEPIFIVGMPRTGTTLVERILTSHSQVLSAGELQNFPLALKKAAGTTSNQVMDVETLEKGTDVDLKALGEAYLESTRPMTALLPHFVDKMPLNFLYIGFIHMALPNAKIICLRRNPMDTCLSNFRQLFAINFSYYNYAYDLMETGEYYVLFNHLMRHWQDILPGKVLEVHYESIVGDQAGESRRIIEFCGLDWEEACLDFDKNTSPVATASSAQVREPIYHYATDRWKKYARPLQPLSAYLESAGIEIKS